MTLAGLLLVLLAACSGGGKGQLDTRSGDAWSTVVSAHTSGIVSRRTEVRVLFSADVLPAGTAPAELLKIEPAVAGKLQVRSARELAWVPDGPLRADQSYTVTLASRGLAGVPADIQPYTFTFRVQKPQFDVTLQHLESDPASDAQMLLRGTLTTADAEDSTAVEKLLTASYLGAARTPVWTHSSDGLTHAFTLAGLARQTADGKVQLRFDGAPIGAGSPEAQEVTVPALGGFAVSSVEAVEEQGRRLIRVFFTDSLDERQNLRGLVSLSPGEFTTRISSNQITLYPQEEPQGEVTVKLAAGIANRRGARLQQPLEQGVTFSTLKPQVRFVGNGTILPDGKAQLVPFEAISARSVHVIATRIQPENIAQFLQVNKFDGDQEIGRVGRYLWRRTLALPGPAVGRWTRYQLDVTELMKKYPGSMFRLTLQLTPEDSSYPCAGVDRSGTTAVDQAPLQDQEDGDSSQASGWDFTADYFGVAGDDGEGAGATPRWRERNDACKSAYYAYNQEVHAEHNLLASNIGLLAKADQRGRLLVTVTDLRTAQPRAGATLSVRNFQGQQLATATSDSNGFANIEPVGTPFLLVAEAGGQRGYLKLNAGNALPVSHFDVGGESISRGLKGMIYGERGVWRPGDDIHLTFVVQDNAHTLPAGHPATLELADPRGRTVQTLINAKPVGAFYRFDVKTAADAPTGDWTARVTLGGVTFSKGIKVETVMPNRLKIALDFGQAAAQTGNQGAGKEPQVLLGAGQPVAGRLDSRWLTGASAAGLKADIKLRLVPTATHFARFTDYVFDDPAREFKSGPEEIFSGELGAQGEAAFSKQLELGGDAPGMLAATFTTRVFERGGAFSISRESATYAPYERFVGLRLPKGDVARGMLQTDQDHVVEIGTLSAAGQPVAVRNLKLSLYKVEWRWWWDKNGDSLAQYVQGRSSALVREDSLSTGADGRAQWKLRIDYPAWGRYLLRVCDEQGGHCSGSTFYIDWPAWAGKQREQNGVEASMLSITADKASYAVGETATLQLPESAQGRALVTIENGSGIIDARWLEPRAGNTRFTVPITAAMTPNVYVAVTLVQPHEGKTNDRPIRLYGVTPLEVTDPKTHIAPQIESAGEWQPGSHQTVKVRESAGHAMTYTLAVVDEGLLSLTNFRTPDPYQQFFKREALGVRTWDLFDDVIGAYGAELERLLALGGSDAAGGNGESQSRSRFPPVVQVLGPFQLAAGATGTHEIELPQYIGAVRVMVVAGDSSGTTPAYGSAEKSVFVRQPLMILPTLPRVVGPDEDIVVPVSVFVSDAALRNVTLGIEPDAMFSVVGDATTQVKFTQSGEQLGFLHLKAAGRLGQGHIRVVASSGRQRVESSVDLQVRSSNPPTTRVQARAIQPGESWQVNVVPHGLPGTNSATLEVSSLPAMNLESRLRYLIQYPNGCLEQTTSAAFPQLYLGALIRMEDARRREVEANVQAAIDKLRSFQLANGGFSYWPGGSGGFATGSLEGYALWASTYASHFLIEAEKAGYSVPVGLRAGAIRHMKQSAVDWNGAQGSTLDQAYRLYVLARAGQPEVGAMNRLRESRALPETERWLLAAAYQLSGLTDVARVVMPANVLAAHDYKGRDYTFGSPLRDHALVLQSLIVLKQLDRSQDVVREIADSLGSDYWYATQSVAFSLMSMAQLAGSGNQTSFSFDYGSGAQSQAVKSDAPIVQRTLADVPQAGRAYTVRNSSDRVLFANVTVRGVPAAAAEDAENAGLALAVSYVDEDGNPLEVAKLRQGRDVIVRTEVSNGTALAIDNIALTQIFPAGWEIQNDRLEGATGGGERDDDAPRQGIPWLDWAATTRSKPEYTDIRDDRVLQYFSLKAGESIRFVTHVNAAYLGRYYLPAVATEAMYDASKHARSKGQWTEVVAQ